METPLAVLAYLGEVALRTPVVALGPKANRHCFAEAVQLQARAANRIQNRYVVYNLVLDSFQFKA